MLKLAVAVLCAINLWVQIKYPQLNVHAAWIAFVTNVLWVWGS